MAIFVFLFSLVGMALFLCGFWGLAWGVQNIFIINRLNGSGVRTHGYVVATHSCVYSARNVGVLPTPTAVRQLVETVEYTTPRGVLRRCPVFIDRGTVDRSGSTVPIIVDPQRPERFIAPRNGERQSTAIGIARIVLSVILILLTILLGLALVGFAGSMNEALPVAP